MKSIFAALLLAAATVLPAHATPVDTVTIIDLVHTFIDAEVHVDAATLRAITSDQFTEISPLGDVDPREKWLGFYKEKVTEAKAQFVIDQTVVRQFGDSAILTALVTFTVQANGTPRSFSARMNFVTHKDGPDWKLVSAQPTPIRPPAKS